MSKRAMQILRQRRADKLQRSSEQEAIHLIGQLASQVEMAQSIACAFAWDVAQYCDCWDENQSGNPYYTMIELWDASVKELMQFEEAKHGGK